MLYFGCWQPGQGAGGADSRPKADSPHPPPHDNQWARAFIRRREGATRRNSTVSSDSPPEIGHVVIGDPNSIILIVLSTVNLQFQGRFAPILWRPVLEIVAAYVMATVWS